MTSTFIASVHCGSVVALADSCRTVVREARGSMSVVVIPGEGTRRPFCAGRNDETWILRAKRRQTAQQEQPHGPDKPSGGCQFRLKHWGEQTPFKMSVPSDSSSSSIVLAQNRNSLRPHFSPIIGNKYERKLDCLRLSSRWCFPNANCFPASVIVSASRIVSS